MPISKDFTSVLEQTWEINFLQYPNGYLKYTDLCNLLQLTAAVHAELGGISFTDMQQFDQAWVLSKMKVDVKKMPRWKDTVRIKTWINSLENSRSIRCLEMYLGDEKIIGCETFWAVFNTTTRRPENLALPHHHFEKFPENKATNTAFSRIDISVVKTVIAEKKVVISDIDIVNHANSVKYLEWCLDYENIELLLSQQLTGFEMNYLKEVSLGSVLIIEKNSMPHESLFTVSNSEKVNFALKLNWI